MIKIRVDQVCSLATLYNKSLYAHNNVIVIDLHVVGPNKCDGNQPVLTNLLIIKEVHCTDKDFPTIFKVPGYTCLQFVFELKLNFID